MMKFLFLPPGGVLRRRAAIALSDCIPTRGRRSFSSFAASKSVGTHDGSFHCDEALGCFIIRRTEKFCDADIVRTRDPLVLDKLDAVLDVGGVYDPSIDRYDHHQRGFEEVFGYGFVTKLSSAGLVYKHYGKEIIAKEVQLESDHPDVHRLFITVYKNFIEAVDAVDNGISQYNINQLPRFINNTSLSSRVERFNPDWVDQNKSPAKEHEAFQQAMEVAGNELLECINFHAKSWLPARSVVIESLFARKNVDSSGEIIVLTHSVPLTNGLIMEHIIIIDEQVFWQWKLHIFELEKEMKITPSIKYVIYPDDRGEKWRLQAVAVGPDKFESRKPLPPSWRGLIDNELSQVSGINGCTFVHISGFIGGNKSYDGALAMAKASLVLS